MICEYGCSTEAKYTLKNGRHCCSTRPSGCSNQKRINSEALKRSYATGRRKPMAEIYLALPTKTKNKMAWSRGKVIMTVEEVFQNGKEWGSELLRKYLHHYNLKVYCCEICQLDSWNNQHITLELDHIDGCRSNNLLSNLRWLCPNCHSQTPTFRGYNKSLTGKIKVTDEELLEAIRTSSSIRQALQKVGLAAKGGNYERAKKLNATVVKSVATRDLEKI